MKLDLFDYDLPPDRIATRPADPRDSARLLLLDGLCDRHVRDLPALLEPDDLLVVNDTRVRAARLYGRRATGGRVEFLFLAPRQALVRANKRLRPGEVVATEGGIDVVLEEKTGAVWRVRPNGDLDAALERAGHVPLPPYIKRPDEPLDRERYQTIFAHETGSAAAPTAGLHFTPELVARLNIVSITLHVGYGTFQPIETEQVEDHRLHAEAFEVSEEAAQRIHSRKGRLIAVGTTTTRVLETLAATGGIRAARGTTDRYLYPGHEFRGIDGLLTNFHLPRSSLLVLVCALAGREHVLEAYRVAVDRGYRFYSYGDAMLVLPRRPGRLRNR